MKHGVEKYPTLVYFNSEIPSIYPDSDLSDSDEVLEWLVNLVEGADIEDITGDMLDKMIMKGMKRDSKCLALEFSLIKFRFVLKGFINSYFF